MSWLQRFLVERLLKGFLDKLPANGKKTILSVLLIVVAVVAQLFPEVAGVLAHISQFLLGLGAEDIRNAGIVGVLVGVLHKFLKGKDEEK